MRQPKVALSLDQYKILLERKRQANGRNVKYKDLIEEWGVKHYHMSTAVYRGIKQYDYILWKEDNRMAKSIAGNAWRG